ncbi:hypothetical protein D3C85_1440470 [compost metagenome]
MLDAVQALHIQLAIVAAFLAGRQRAAHVGEQGAGRCRQCAGFLQQAGVAAVIDSKAAGFFAGLEQQLSALGSQFALHAGLACGRGGLRLFSQHLAAGKQRQQGDKQQRRGGTHQANSSISSKRCRHVTQAARRSQGLSQPGRSGRSAFLQRSWHRPVPRRRPAPA